jgi:hypothetical protein
MERSSSATSGSTSESTIAVPQAAQGRRKSGIRGVSIAETERDDGKHVLTESQGWSSTGFAFPTWKKWMVSLLSSALSTL